MAKVQTIRRNDTGTIIATASGGSGNPRDMLWLLSDPAGDGLGAKRNNYAQQVLVDGPLGYWRGSVSGNTVPDFTGVYNGTLAPANATIVGGVTLGVAGAIPGDTAMTFNGSTGVVDAGNVATLAFTTAFSAEAWFKIPSNVTGGVIGKALSSGPGWQIYCIGGKIRFWGYTAAAVSILDITTDLAYGDNAWHLITVTWNGLTGANAAKIYIDGALVKSGTVSAGTLAVGTNPFQIGAINNSIYFTGSIDEVATYPFELSAAQITARYAARTVSTIYAQSVLNDGATHYWRLNEASGTLAVDQISGVTFGAPGALADGNPSMVFNGASGRIGLPSISIPLTATIELWVKTTSTAFMSAFGITAGAGTIDVGVGQNGGTKIYTYNGSTVWGTKPVGDGQWHHVVVVYVSDPGGAFVRIYVDGVLDVTGTNSRSSASNTPCAIGSSQPAANYFKGNLDEIAIYPYMLTDAQIASHYALRTVQSGLIDWSLLNNTKTILPPTPTTSGYAYFAAPPVGSYVVQFVSTAYSAIIAADGPTYYWRLDDTSGALAKATIGGIDGTISGGVQLGIAGAVPGSTGMNFNGDAAGKIATGSVTIPVVCTIEAWVQLYSTIAGNVRAVFSTRKSTNTGQQVYFGHDSLYRLYFLAAGTPILGAKILNDNLWHHVVVSMDGTSVWIYVDGQMQNAGGIARTQASVGPAGIGYDDLGPVYFYGGIDEVAVYPYVLTPSQVQTHYFLKNANPITVYATDRADVLADGLVVLEFELGGKGNGWTSINDLLLKPGVSWHRGLPGNDVLDLVADIGVMSFTLDNSEKNTKRLVGLYSPDHANKMYGFYLNIGVRLRHGSVVRFTGILSAIDPVPGKWGPRTVACEASDWMSIADRTRISNLPVLVNKRGDEVFQALIDNLIPAVKPDAVQKDLSPDTYPYTLDRTRDEQTVLRDELYRLAVSGMSRIFVIGDGTLIYESRTKRASANANVDVFDDSSGFTASQDRTGVINRAQSTIHPRLPSTTLQVMYSLPQPLQITGETPITVLGTWVDPANPETRVGAVSLQALVRGTDYAANTLADGTGTDLTPTMVVTAGLSGNATSFTIQTTQNGFITKLQQRGFPLFDYGSAILTAEDQTSVGQFGLTAKNIDMPYSADPQFALEVAQFIVYNGAFPSTNISGFVRIVDVRSTADRLKSTNRMISDRIGITDPVTGVARAFFINGIEESLVDRVLTTTWLLVPADTTSYWELEVDGKTELDVSTVLGFGQILGHVDIAHQDSHTDVVHQDVIHVDVHGDDVHQDTAHADAPNVHNDVVHTDIPHGDAGHQDQPGENTHGDVIHLDQPASNSHGDVTHVDEAHQDSSGGTHTDTPGVNFTDHVDCYAQWNQSGGLWHMHMDCQSSGGNFHSDEAHDDVHGDGSGPYEQYHDDGAPHSDVSHGDSGQVSHADSHGDRGHTDEHGDSQHADRPPVNTHGDRQHVDQGHQDGVHYDVPHSDGTGHADRAHLDTPHNDIPHQDVVHVDVIHQDVHADFHGDAN